MATINPTQSNDVSALGSAKQVQWVLPTTGDVGAPVRLDRYSISSFSVFGSAVTALALEASNDVDAPANWNALRDWGGASLAAVNAAGIYTPRDLPLWIRPRLTTGTNVTVQVALHRQDQATAG